MGETFNFGRVPDIYFGTGKFTLVPNLLKEFGTRILVVTGKNSFIQTGYWAQLQELFTLHKLEWIVTTIPKEPTPILIDSIVSELRNLSFDAVLAIGGGSVIDGGKAIAAMLPIQEPIIDYLEEFGSKYHSGQSIPLIAVPTTAGTGSETTRYAMLSEVGERGLKKKLQHTYFVPKVAIIDPNMTKHCSPFLTAIGGINAFSQLAESFLSLGSTELTDTLSFKGISYIVKSLPVAYRNGRNTAARSAMAYASMVSGVTSSNTGLGTTNGLAMAIAGRFDIPFSVLCATLMAEVHRVTVEEALKYPKENKQTLEKYARVGRLLHKSRGKSNQYYKNVLLKKVRKWGKEYHIPNLSYFGIKEKDFEEIAFHTENQNNPMPLSEAQIIEVLKAKF